jgi:uncharacterized protein (DUF2249 family)
MSRNVELDVRHYHAEGREPFADIMAAISGLESGDSLVLRNTFEPVPLYGVLAGRGFSHAVKQESPSDWFITFTKA